MNVSVNELRISCLDTKQEITFVLEKEKYIMFIEDLTGYIFNNRKCWQECSKCLWKTGKVIESVALKTKNVKHIKLIFRCKTSQS